MHLIKEGSEVGGKIYAWAVFARMKALWLAEECCA
jgi:hypothetical protein